MTLDNHIVDNTAFSPLTLIRQKHTLLQDLCIECGQLISQLEAVTKK